ncbi:MAG: regulatory protein RecX [Candidatus Nomurabacteria bacterium]|nr:MAG: regulatory protein RecX [Candidatus Nomurabacteria bacterium]
MPIITDIKIQVKNRDKVSVYIDEKYSFSLTISQLTDHKQVRVKSHLKDDQVEDLKKLSSQTNQYLRLLNLIYARPRSEYEIRTKLRLKKFEQEEIDQLVDKLKKEGYLNDKEFANWWVNSRKLTRNISSLKLKSELAQKGIKGEVVEDALANNFSKEDELNSLKDLVKNKKNKYESEQKLMSYLVSKGFNYSQIKEVLNKEETS